VTATTPQPMIKTKIVKLCCKFVAIHI